MTFSFAISAFAAISLAAAPQGIRQEPITYASYVSLTDGRCTYQTGDVIFDEAQFRADLASRFDTKNDMVIYYGAGTPSSCVEKARKIVESLGFHHVEAKTAPANLDMGPPRTVVD